MIAGWTVILSALVYLCFLFVVAQYGDRGGRSWLAGRSRATVYALGLSVYCTSWTIYGSVDFASMNGIAFLGIYVGPMLVFLFGTRLISRIARIAKSQNSTSIADLIAARYGKNELVAAAVALIALVSVIPYIALQLKAVSASLTALLASIEGGSDTGSLLLFGDLSLIVALVLSGFAVAFGTRHIDATEHQDGLMLAIAMEAIVKLAAFIAVGLVIVAPEFLNRLPAAAARARSAFEPWRLADPVNFMTMAGLSVAAILLLPRQFHVTFVENRNLSDIRRSRWMFPLYLVLINILVLPIASAGLGLAPRGSSDNAMLLLAVPLQRGETVTALIAFIGGLSASTAMVIVDSIAVAIMISNHLAVPLVLRFSSTRLAGRNRPSRAVAPRRIGGDMTGFILSVRRAAIIAVVMLGYLYFRSARGGALAAIGLLSFAAIAQIFPSFVAALFWRSANARGALAGLAAGSLVWLYTLLLPAFAGSRRGLDALISHGPWGIAWLRPEHLLGIELPPLAHGVFWSMAANVAALVLCSLSRAATTMEQAQAIAFLDRDNGARTQLFTRRAMVSVADLRATVARYLGPERAARAFDSFLADRGTEPAEQADPELIRHAEHLLSSAVGAASARLVLALLTRRQAVSSRDALQLLGDTSAALQQDRDLLQHALDHARQGISVIDKDRRLLAWNRAWLELYDLPAGLVSSGVMLDEIIRFNARRGLYGAGDEETLVEKRLRSFFAGTDPVRLRIFPSRAVIEVRSNSLPDGGLVTTYTDVTHSVTAEEELATANATLEGRVKERTSELERLNAELTSAKALADEANASKTRFLAAASHDILQPLNAARLYASAFAERPRAAGAAEFASHVDGSLEVVEGIISELLDIARFDAGAMRPEIVPVRLDDLLRQLEREFGLLAEGKGLKLLVASSSAIVSTDRLLLRRLLQNLLSNALKYTRQGGVLVGARRRGDRVVVEVWDSGVGIHESQQAAIFEEFKRLPEGASQAQGLGLGLSIVRRIADLLRAPLKVRSRPRRGSVFSVSLPRSSDIPKRVAARRISVRGGGGYAGLKILVIDNEPSILAGMRTLMEGWGCACLIALDECEAIAVLEKEGEPPHFIIADYHLDEGDGITAIGALRRRFGLAIPAIMITADRGASVRRKAQEAEIDVLHKPLKPAALRALLTRKAALAQAAE